jgi:hypothetical protein
MAAKLDKALALCFGDNALDQSRILGETNYYIYRALKVCVQTNTKGALIKKKNSD